MKIFKFLVSFAILLSAVLAGALVAGKHGGLAGLATIMALLCLMSSPLSMRPTLGITVSADLKVPTILDSALLALREELLAIRGFATAFYDKPLQGTDEISVPYYPLETATSKDFDGEYQFDDAEVQSKKVTVNKRKYQSLAISSSEFRRQPKFNPEEFGRTKGQKLAEDIIADILSLVTAANFGAAVFTGAASTFDSDDVADLQGAATVAKWPKIGRSLVLDTTYHTALMKDDAIKQSPHQGITEEALVRGYVEMLNGFAVRPTNLVPANGENLKGFINYMSAILVGFSPIEPHPDVRKNMTDYQIVVDDITGLALEYRQWGDPDSDTSKRVIECNYGYALGEAAALKRIVSA